MQVGVLMAASGPLAVWADDDPEEGPMIGWFLRGLPYVVGLGLAMAILAYGAVPQFRSFFAQRRAASATVTGRVVASAAGDGAAAVAAPALTRRLTESLDFSRYPDVALNVASDRITLEGIVPSDAARSALEADVRRVAPDLDVLNLVEVAEPTAPTEQTGPTAAVTATTLGGAVGTATTVPTTAAPTTTTAAATTTAAPPTTTAAPPTTAAAPPSTTAAPPAATPTRPAATGVDGIGAVRALLAAEPIRFASSDPQPLAESQATLDRLAALLLALGKPVEIAGHTDDVGSEAANLDLSQERAGRVRNELIARGVPAERLVAIGYGSARPVVPNDSEVNRLLNRRIDVVVTEG